MVLGGRPKHINRKRHPHLHINPEKGTSLHVHAVPEKGTSIDKRHINSFNSPMCMLSLNESGLEAILAFGTTLWKKHPFLSIWVEILYQKMLTALQSRFTFLGRAPLPLLWTRTNEPHVPDRQNRATETTFFFWNTIARILKSCFGGCFPMGTASRYHFLPAYDLAPPLAYIENLLDNRLCKGARSTKSNSSKFQIRRPNYRYYAKLHGARSSDTPFTNRYALGRVPTHEICRQKCCLHGLWFWCR